MVLLPPLVVCVVVESLLPPEKKCKELMALALPCSAIDRSLVSKIVNCSSRRGDDRTMMTLNVIPVAWRVYPKSLLVNTQELKRGGTYSIGKRIKGI